MNKLMDLKVAFSNKHLTTTRLKANKRPFSGLNKNKKVG
jgi:hypothetical protein